MPLEFYKLVAQIIPILFLSVSLQSLFVIRGTKYSRSERTGRDIHVLSFMALAYILISGEIEALEVVYQGYPTDPNSIVLVCFAMAAPVYWIIWEHILFLFNIPKALYGILLVAILIPTGLYIAIQLWDIFAQM